jgi:hypothetical protein
MTLQTQANIPIDWKIARPELIRLLNALLANVNGSVKGADVGETGTAIASMTASNKPGANNKTSPDTWLKVNLHGTIYYVPAYLP